MFSSANTNVNPLIPQLSSFNPSCPYVISDHHHRQANDTSFSHFTIPTHTHAMLSSSSSNYYKQDLDDHHRQVLNGDQCNYNSSFNLHHGKKPVKKDRHSKICTAQGLRDRRIRLSIQIARKFFDLQDMLGFDKASRTLEWLLNKSKKAIKELSGSNNKSNFSCEDVYRQNGEIMEGVDGIDSNASTPYNNNNKSLGGGVCGVEKLKKLSKASSNNIVLAKESRAKARARARERTRVKMCTRRLHESFSTTKCPDDTEYSSNPNILVNQSRSLLNQQHQSCEKLGSNYCQNITSSSSLKVFAHEVDHHHHSFGNQALATEGNIIEESILIKRKLKPSTFMGYHEQNLLMLKDVSCNNNNCSSSSNYLPNSPQNLGINSAIACSSFCAITNMNLSTGLQFYGKP